MSCVSVISKEYYSGLPVQSPLGNNNNKSTAFLEFLVFLLPQSGRNYTIISKYITYNTANVYLYFNYYHMGSAVIILIMVIMFREITYSHHQADNFKVQKVTPCFQRPCYHMLISHHCLSLFRTVKASYTALAVCVVILVQFDQSRNDMLPVCVPNLST